MEEFEGKIFGREKKELEENIKEALNSTSKMKQELEESQDLLLAKRRDDVNRMLIEYYDKKQGTYDIQKSLQESFVEGAMEKLQEREEKKALEDLDLPDDVSENVKKEALERVKKEGKSKELTEEDLKSELYKAIYEEVFEKYSVLMDKIKDKQIREGSLTVGDKEGTELIIYERYLVGIEMANHKIGGTRFSDDPRISELRKSFKERFDQKQKQVDDVTRESIDELKHLYEEKNEIAEQIEYYTINSHLVSKEKTDALREKYFSLSYEIREQEPTLEEYSSQIDELEKNRDFAEREGIGESSSTDRDVAAMSIDSVGDSVLSGPDADDIKSSTLADTKDNIEDVEALEESEEKSKEFKKAEFIRRYSEAKEKGDIYEMNMIIMQYRDDLDVDRIIEEDRGEEEVAEVSEEEYEYNDFIGGLNAINNDDEIIEQMNKRADENLEEKEPEREDVGISRTRFNGNF